MLSLLCIFILIIIAFKKKHNIIILILLCSISALIIGLNSDNPDYVNYESAFDNAYGRLTEFDILNVLDLGTKTILLIGHEIGFHNYADFRFAYTVILFILFGITVSKTCVYGATFFALYIISYIFLDETQFRNFSSFVVLLPFLIYYINNQNRKGLVIFLVGDILAFSLHFSAIFYLMFCLTLLKSKSLKILFVIFTFIFIAAIGMIETNIAMIDHTDHYEAPSIAGGIVSCLLLVINYVIIRSIYKTFVKKNKSHINPIVFNSFEVIVQINLLLLILCPAVLINATVLRIWRFTSIVNLIYLLNLAFIYKGKKNESKLTFYSLIYSGVIGYWFNRVPGVYESIFNNPLL